MGIKKFHTRRMWSNTLLMLWVAPFLLLAGAISVAMTNHFWIAGVLVTVAVIGLVVALLRDTGNRCTYAMEGGTIVLDDGHGRLVIGTNEIVDASLIDRMAAREYIRSKVFDMGQEGTRRASRATAREMTRFCSVDLGLTTLTFGMGRSMIDRMPQSRNDLVLLRLRGGKDYFLSPAYNLDLVGAISRMIRKGP